MRNKVLNLLRDQAKRPEERYNWAMELYRKSEGMPSAALNFYNRSGYNGANLQNILYDLQKHYGISDVEVKSVGSANPKKRKKNGSPAPNPKKLTLLGFDPKTANYHEALALAKDIGLKLPDQKKATVFGYLEAAATKNITVTDPETVEAGIEIDGASYSGKKLREEFPFLSSEDCPDKFKILVADMLTAWENYQKAHAELLSKVSVETADNGDIFVLSDTAIKEFEANKAIWDELNHYKEHGEILGNHPIFKDEMLAQKVKALKDADAVKRRNNLRSYISRETKQLDKAKATKKATIQAKIDEFKKELKLLEARLGGQE